MRVSVLARAGVVELIERDRPTPAQDEVLVRVVAVGVCGSDTHYFDHGRIGHFVVESPLVLGHEAAGVIEEVGAEVDPSRVGQRVSIEPGVPCRRCRLCLSGHYNLCADMVFYATPPVDGALAEYVTIHEAFAHPVPDVLSDDAAALLEPLSVALWAAQRAGIRAGSRVLVTGCGPIGLIAVQTARAFGATDVIASDVNAHRLALAREMGATQALDTSAQVLSEVGVEADVLLECSGHPAATLDALRVLAPAGRAVLVGTGSHDLAIPLQLVQEKELELTGTFRYAGTWPVAINLVATGAVDLDRLVTAHFALAESSSALTAGRDDPHAVKSVIRPQE
ncbi:NAD(P)-dependent alcohol dehydrogenase [Luteipulveratus mongoliensis]|uniref:Sorbitol dehydrogenase n=1 Tax=Luteipulveratus mongoliensis TaxID=571913 RepID=A0A0K1JJ94_9MICO|nr:NAD(P)-dependent alcohol dehydrogenase [Luteipulveratus mongoliensis]AKU16660.1 sorbitol dehydrogenase [Luteipulveratus mongoliensis]